MAGRGATSFQKRQKEQQRKERQQQKFEKRLERKKQSGAEPPVSDGETILSETEEHPASES